MLMTLPGKRTKTNRKVTTDHNTTRPSGYRDRQSGKLQAYRSFAATHLHVYDTHKGHDENQSGPIAHRPSPAAVHSPVRH